MKFYMPLHCDLYERNDYGDLDEYPDELGGREALEYADEISAAIEAYKMPEEAERGLMHWYHENDGVNEKVHSAVFSVEERMDTLWGIVVAELKEELDAPEVQTLKDYLSGQASDGWGEGFEQREIKVEDGGELYVHLWDAGRDWQLMTEAEFVQQYEQTQAHAPQMDGPSY